jgi:anaerobic selenocysteine-containing dehydrogenase
MEDRGYVLVPHEKPFRHKDGRYTVTRGSTWSGPGCHDGCGVLLYTDDEGRLVKVAGDPENPYNQGRLCVRCLDLKEVVYHQDRLTYPMRRDPKDRGRDVWERMSWDEAYDLIEERFKDIRDRYGAESIGFAQGTGRDIAAYISRLAWSFGSPNFMSIFSGIACYAPRVAGCYATTGAFWVADCSQQFADRYDNPQYRVPETIFVWGNYPLKSNSDGFYGHWLIDIMKRGTKVVMVDPKATWLSARSVLHLPVRPGTDAALALGMLNVIITEGLYDHDFVDRWCYGFEEFKERVLTYSVEDMAASTWVPKEKIVEAARLLAASRPAALQWGVAVDMTKEALPAGQAIMALFQITGNCGVPGGMIIPPEILSYAGGWGRELISEEQKAKRIGLDRYGLLRQGFQLAQPDVFVETLETKRPYEIHGLWLQTHNVLSCMGADPKTLYDLTKDLDFIVCVDLFKTPTIMALADVVLPAATFAERDGIRIGDGAQRGEAINKAIQVGECKSDMEINLELGKRFNPEGWPWENLADMFSYMVAPTGMSFPELQEMSPAYMPFEYRSHETGQVRYDGQIGFNTTTGRIELWSNYYNEVGLDPLPYFEEPSPGPGATPKLLDEFPLVLTTGARNWSLFHSEHRQIPRLRAIHKDPLVQVHPEAAATYGVGEGDWVWIENPRGRAKRKVSIVEFFDPRIIACDHGWWYPEGDPEKFYDVFDLNINNLVPWGQQGKCGFGANYKTTLCKIYKVEED